MNSLTVQEFMNKNPKKGRKIAITATQKRIEPLFKPIKLLPYVTRFKYSKNAK